MPIPIPRFAFVSVLLALIGPAFASQDAVAVAAEWGLLGTWAVDCSRAPSHESARLSFLQVDGKLVHRRDFGGSADEFPVTAARVRKDGSLEIELDFASFGQRRQIVFAKAGEGKKRALVNRAIGGDYSIRDGKFVGSGSPAPEQTRCAALTN